MIVVLDAMGVMYRTPEGWSGNLSSFVDSLGATRARDKRDEFVSKYYEVTKGICSTEELWCWCGLEPAGLDERYASGYVTNPGLRQFVDLMGRLGVRLACLSNDALPWSVLLRERFGLAKRFEAWVISSEVGVRKPDVPIYEVLQEQMDVPWGEMVLVDDTTENLDTAAALGMRTVLFAGRPATSSHTQVADFGGLGELVWDWISDR